MLLSLLLFLAGLAFVWRFRRRARARISLTVEVLSRVPCGPRQAVVLLRVGERVLVTSQTDAGMQLLAELEGEEREQALTPMEPSPPPFRFPTFRPASLLLLVALCAGSIDSAVAQAPAAADSAASLVDVLPPVEMQLGAEADGLRISGTVGVVLFMGVLTLLPAMVLMMTGFTRILIVLHFLRSAMGTQTTPPGQLLVGIAALLAAVVMAPTLQEVNTTALQPFLEGSIDQSEAFARAVEPFRAFMLANTRQDELGAIAGIRGEADVTSFSELSTVTLMASFVLSELKTAFLIGFVIFLPFTVLDLVVASVLMSMGMFMLPPVMVSLPFKLLLFVLADGWTLIVTSLIGSFFF